MVTARDVAKRAGVSPSTVSHTFNGKRPVSPEVRQSVLQAARELGYQPDALARSLRTRQTKNLGLYVHSLKLIRETSFQRFLEGLTQEAVGRGYRVVLLGETGCEGPEDYANICRNNLIDGVILRDPDIEDVHIHKLMDNKVPFVVLGRPNRPLTSHYVDNDNVTVGRVAVHHLLELGHRRIAFINGPADLTVSADRLLGYRRALQEWKVAYDRSLVVNSDFTTTGGYRETCRLLARDTPFTAIWAANDLMAIGALRALREYGLKVAESVSVLGVNNDLVAETCEPPLSTVEINPRQLGASAAAMLVELITEGELETGPVIIPVELVIRRSTAPPPRSLLEKDSVRRSC